MHLLFTFRWYEKNESMLELILDSKKFYSFQNTPWKTIIILHISSADDSQRSWQHCYDYPRIGYNTIDLKNEILFNFPHWHLSRSCEINISLNRPYWLIKLISWTSERSILILIVSRCSKHSLLERKTNTHINGYPFSGTAFEEMNMKHEHRILF